MPRPRLKRLWRLSDLEVPTSVLDAQPANSTLLALGPEVAGKRDLVAVDVGSGTVRWRTPLEKWRGTALLAIGAWALTVDDRNTVAAFDLTSGKPRWKRPLDCRFHTGDDLVNRGSVLNGRCSRYHGAFGEDGGEALAIDLRDGTVIERGPWERPRTPAAVLERHRSTEPRAFGGEGPDCWAVPYQSEFPLYQFPSGSEVSRSGRPLWLDCEGVDALDGSGDSLRPPDMPDLEFAAVVAVGVRGRFVQILLASRSAPPQARAAVFDGRRLVAIADAPAPLSELVTLTEGVVVVRRGGEQSREGQALGLFPPQPTALEGYATSQLEAGDEIPDVAERTHVRRLLKTGGRYEWIGCEPGRTRFDPVTFAALLPIPHWQQHVAALLADPDELVQNGAIAAAVEARTPTLDRALVRKLEQLSESIAGGSDNVRHSSWRGPQEQGWYETVAGEVDSRRIRLTSALLHLRSAEAIPAFAGLLLEDRTLGYDYVTKCSPFIPAICRALAASDQLAAHAALAAYDRKLDTPGAWRVVCDER